MSESEKDETFAGFEFDDLLAATLRKKGLMIPVSVQEVEKAEAEIDEQTVRLPESLEDPFTFLNRPRRSNVLRFRRASEPNDGFQEELARVAREGSEISDEVADRMRRDRQEAEEAIRDQEK